MRVRGPHGQMVRWAGLVALGLAAAIAHAQGTNAALNDSILAREGLASAREFAGVGNLAQAVRVVQSVLDGDAEKVIESADDPSVFVPVRDRVHAALRSDAALLARYREAEGPRAQQLLDAGNDALVERTRLLTRAGLTAALRRAQRELEGARFYSARSFLEEVREHPDRRQDRDACAASATLAGLLVKELPEPEVKTLADEFAKDAAALGLRIAEPTVAAPPAPVPSRTALDAGPSLDLSRIPTRALRSVTLESAPGDLDDPLPGPPGRARRVDPVAFPAVAGNLLLVNDGTRVSALECDTFAPLWTVEPGDPTAPARANGDAGMVFLGYSRSVDDVASACVGGLPGAGVVVATTGIDRNGRHNGDTRIHAIDAGTGAPIWSVDPALLDKALELSSVRGPLVVEGDTVVASLRRQGPMGRETGVLLIGLDLYTGELRWQQLMGVLGQLPWGVVQRRADAMLLDHGIVYRADEIGVVGAYEASTGRPRWVRRMPANRTFDVRFNRQPEPLPPYTLHRPVLAGGWLFVQEPGEGNILRIDPSTGRLLGSRSASALGGPRYLLSAGDFLVGVGASRVAVVKLADADEGTVHLSPTLIEAAGLAPTAGNPIVGRAVVAGDKVLVPLPGKVAAIDPANPEQISLTTLDGSGTLLAAPGYLLAADDKTLRGFIAYDEAAALLRARVAGDPRGTGAMLAYVELALRAGKPEQAAPYAEQALDALDLAQASGDAPRPGDRRRLFDLLLGALRPGAGVGETKTQDRLAASLERAAESHEERATELVRVGTMHEARGEPGKAAEAFQAILSDETLARALLLPALDAGAGALAGQEADRRLTALIVQHGTALYAGFANEAARASAELPPGAGPERLMELARRYPLAPTTPDLWARAAKLLGDAHKVADATAAWGRGLHAAEVLVHAGATEQLLGVSRLGRELCLSLNAAGNASAAYRLLVRLNAQYPLALESGDVPVDVPALRASLADAVAKGTGLAHVGSRVDPSSPPQALQGWRLGDVLIPPGPGSPTDCAFLHSPTTSSVALFVASPEEGALAQAWSRHYDAFAPTALKVGLDRTYLFWPGARGGSVEAIDNASGRTLWKSDEFGALFTDEPKRAGDDRFPVPLAGEVRAADLIVSIDDRTLVLVERGGRGAAFDAEDGRRLWAMATPLTRVYDIAGSGDLVVLAGVREEGGADAHDLPPRLLSLDRRAGTPGPPIALASREPTAGAQEHVRWLRSDGQSRVLVAFAGGLAAFEPATGRTAWDQRNGHVVDAIAGLVSDGQVLALDANRHVWLLSTADGTGPETPLESEIAGQNKVDFPLHLARVHGKTVLAGSRGVLVYDTAGALVGADALPPDSLLLTPAVAHGLVATVVKAGNADQDEAATDAVELVLLDTQSARVLARDRLVLSEEPLDLGFVDGKLLLTVGATTFALDLPAR